MVARAAFGDELLLLDYAPESEASIFPAKVALSVLLKRAVEASLLARCGGASPGGAPTTT